MPDQSVPAPTPSRIDNAIGDLNNVRQVVTLLGHEVQPDARCRQTIIDGLADIDRQIAAVITLLRLPT